jgi:hypothetical protein
MQTVMDRLGEQPTGASPPVQVRHKHKEFLKGRPLMFKHATDPMKADDWLRAVEK